jgi:hypothetical protein
MVMGHNTKILVILFGGKIYMIKIQTVNVISVQDFDSLVEKTYGRTYSFQQQDGCKDRGTYEFTLPFDDEYVPEDHESATVEEEVNSEDMGVSFASWLARDPNQKLDTEDEWDRDHGLCLWWERNFYPHVDVVVDDLYKRGLIPAGKYLINIDW